ncbi:cyclic AMP response element-binding protein A isoform X2 [Parasteatoda tepidariorum]|uniref:cyclic AMP response element-binding protein A isoform X2 n=1 Tax=Parasteatoda tepidariorum TaxID=114398 RepID=UPI00077FB8E4|nr:cyclic AMP response element-binding protein A isoform X2 [Parasteatoda tepidariorum]
MVRSFSKRNRRGELVCVYPDVDLIKSCDPNDIMFSSDDTMDPDVMEECQNLAEEMHLDSDADWTQILDHQPIVLNDRMMTDAVQSPHIQSEHSYSLTLNDELPQSPFGHNIKLEDYDKDMESECFPAVSISSSSGQTDFVEDIIIKQEPASPPPAETSSRSHNLSTISSLLNAPSPPLSSASSALHPQSLLKQPTIVLAARPSSLQSSTSRDNQMLYPKVNIKVEPAVSTSGFSLPPTPPSCNGSDSEGSLSPVHGSSSSHSSSSLGLLSTSSSSSSSTQSSGHTGGRKSHAKVVMPVTSKHSSNSQTALISSQPKGATGVLHLTDEEKRTLLAEGYHIPQKLPLTKAEERSLKKIRRKIKNKISAQESRRKKKEYMDALEKKVEILSCENSEYKKKLDSLEGNNRSLLSQLQHLQAILSDMPSKRSRNAATQTLPSLSSVRHNDGVVNSEVSSEVRENGDAKRR